MEKARTGIADLSGLSFTMLAQVRFERINMGFLIAYQLIALALPWPSPPNANSSVYMVLTGAGGFAEPASASTFPSAPWS